MRDMETRHIERSGKLVAALCVMVLIVPLVFCIPLIVADLSHTHDTNSRPYTLFFPDIIAGKDWKTTISVANPSSKEASISEAFFAPKGEFLESLSASLRLGPGESRQIESKRLPTEASWLKVAASGPVLGRLSVASNDGKKSESMPVTGRTSRVSDFPLLLQDGVQHKALTLLNPSEGSAGMEIIALDENGVELAREALPELPSMENVRVFVSDVFEDDTVLENVATFRVVSDREIAGMQIENPPDADLVGMPALTRTGAEWFLPVIKKASGAELYTTAYVFNSGKSSATVAMEAFDASQSSLGVFDRTVLLPGAIHAVSSSNLDGIIPAGADLLRISGSGDIAVYEVIGLVEGTGRTAIMGLLSRVRALAGSDITFSADKGALTAVSKPASPNETSRKPGESADGKNLDSKNKTGLTALYPDKAAASRVDVCGEIATDSVWSSANLYVVTCDVIVASGATLTIQPGTTVKLVNGTWSGMQQDIIVKGGLIANGTAGAPIVFTSYADDTKGGDTNGDEANSSPLACDWGSLFFAAGSHGSISNAYIAYGGGGGYIGLDLGIYTSGLVESRTSDLALDSTTLHKSGRAGLYAAGASVNVTNSTISANAYNGLHYEGLDPSRPLTVTDNVFKDGNGAHRSWDAQYAGSIVVSGNTPKISILRNTATGNAVNGFAMRGLISSDMLWGNADKMALTIPQVDADFIVGTGATLTLEPGAIVKLGSGAWSGMVNDLIVLGSLQAEGTEALPIAFTSLTDDTHGGDTNGDSTASTPARGDWGCILFRPGSTAKISNAFVGYGGTVGYIGGDMGFYSTGMIMSQSSGVSLDLSTIQSSATYGLYAKDASNNVTNSKIAANWYNGLHYEGLDPAKPLTVANNVFSDGNGSSKGWDTAYAGSVVLNGNPPEITFKKNTASGNATNAFGVRGLITSDLAWENTNSIPLLVHGVDRDLIVGTGATLTLLPGTIMKFGVGSWSGMVHDLIVKGTLNAEGTTAAPIVFTSVADDSSGGDTNNDGSDSSPANGDWGCILFASGSHGRVSNATMKYGGTIGFIGGDIGIYNGGMVHSLSSDVVLDHVSIKNAANNGLLAVNAGVINRNGTIAKNAFGVATNNGSNYWVDARSCYWGDASGPYHSVKNPGGKGDKVGENVLFYPWAEDPTGTLTQQIRMQILGPGRISPGDLAEYVISFTTGRAVKGAVLVASLPETAEYLESSDGGSYMHESHQVYWKLGDLKQYQEGLYRVKTRFMWGIPNDFEDGVSAIMSGTDTDLGGYTFNIARYKNYVPIGVISSTIMGDAAVEAELSAHADMKTLHDNAVADGFTRVGGAQAGFDSQTFTLIEMASRVKGAKAEIRRNHSDGSITAHFFYPSLYVVKDVNGGMTLNLDLDTVEFTGTWTAATAMDLLSGDEDDIGDESDADDSVLAETYGPMTASEDEAEIRDWPDYSPEAAITKGVAFRNCILTQIPKWTIKKISAIVKTTLNAKDCAKALYNLDPADMLPCMQMFKQVGETVPFVGEMKMLHKCYWDVVIGGQLEKYACSAEKPLYKVEPPTLSLSDPKSWFGRWQRASYVKYECDPTTQMWKFAGTLYCDTGYVAQDGANDSDGRPCVPANEDWAFVNEELYQKPGDKKVPSRSVKTVARQARDPNEKFGPPGNVIAGQQMDYRITYENEGAGIAYGVFILDQLNDAIDDTTLQIGGNAEYLARSRTIMWDIGELQPKGETGSKGEVSFSAKLKSDLKNGTTVSNRAVVFFPSVPEETPTNPVINVVRSLSALPQSVTAFSGQSLNIVLQGQDAGGATLTYKTVDKPLNGSLTGTPPNVVYKSTANFTGGDRFSFVVSNGTTQSEAADVSVTVEPSPNDTTPPKVAWTSPYKDEVVKQAGTKPAYNDSIGPVYLPTLVLEFSEIVDPATVNDQTVHLVDGTGREVAATAVYDTQSGRGTVTVRQPWKSGVYTATVGIGVADQNGNHMTSEYSWSFKAVAAANLPTVTIKATDAAASEPGTNKGKFEVIRKGNLKRPLTVKYSISGTAAPDKDYKKLSGKVTIPKRKSSAAIVVAPLDDQLDETAETVILKLLKSSGYKVGKPGKATVKIKDND